MKTLFISIAILGATSAQAASKTCLAECYESSRYDSRLFFDQSVMSISINSSEGFAEIQSQCRYGMLAQRKMTKIAYDPYYYRQSVALYDLIQATEANSCRDTLDSDHDRYPRNDEGDIILK